MAQITPAPAAVKNVVQKAALFFAILIPAGLAYLLLANRFGFYSDDWYVIYGLTSQGVAKLKDIYIIDRPARAYSIGALYSLFGNHAPLYSYSGFILRSCSAAAFFWIIRMIWPARQVGAYLASALFLLYPGFLEQPNAFEFQTHILSFTIAVFSIGFSVKACLAGSRRIKVLFMVASAVTAPAYMALMEYYFGLEGVRFILIFYLCRQQEGSLANRFGRQLIHTVRQGWLSLLAAGSYLTWRVFIFDNQRSNTDLGSMVGDVAAAPLFKGLWMLNFMLQDFLNVTFFAWAVPVYDLVFPLRLKDFWRAVGVGGAAALIFFVIIYFGFQKWVKGQGNDHQDEKAWGRDLIMIGLFSVLCTSLPIVLGGRHVSFASYSRFSLPGSIGGVLFITGLFFMFYKNLARLLAISVLVGLAVTVHHANSIQFANTWDSMRTFWWQMVWRAPQIQPDTVLYTQYANAGLYEDYIAWGPANLIYSQESSAPNTFPLRLSATVINHDAVKKIRLGGKETRERRGMVTVMNFDNPLVLTMPSQLSCLHAANGRQPEYSEYDSEQQYLLAPYSRIDRIVSEGDQILPPPEIFGEEPAHGWCYYYQKADLARQKNDWQEVLRLEKEAKSLRLNPDDSIEWLPFMQAQALVGDLDSARQYIPLLKVNQTQAINICAAVSNMDSGVIAQYPQGYQFLKSSFCD